MSGFEMFMYALAIIALYRGELAWAIFFFIGGVI